MKKLLSLFTLLLLAVLSACTTPNETSAGYNIHFNMDEFVQISVYTTKDFSEETSEYVSRDSEDGQPLLDGEGQVNFRLNFKSGYCLSEILIEGDYKNLKTHKTDPDSLALDEYRITKIKSDITVTISSMKDEETPTGYNVNFEASNAKIYLYETQDYSLVPVEGLSAQSRDKDGAPVKNGEGQVNFKVVCDDGYVVSSIIVSPDSNYKNLKDSEDTLVEGMYRITKILGDITVVITTVKE